MLDKLNHYSLTNPATVYDEEAMTALELAGRTAAKVNECVDQVNDIPAKIAADVQQHIDEGEFDNQIDKHNAEIMEHIRLTDAEMSQRINVTDARLDNLTAAIPAGGSTSSRDAEVIDGRVSYDGVTYASLGAAIRAQFGKTAALKTPTAFDADVCQETAIHIVSSDDEWTNLPPDGAANGFLFVYYGGGPYRIYQVFISYGDNIYLRHAEGGTFKPWVKWLTAKETLSIVTMTGLDTFDIDAAKTIGLYRLGSSIQHNAPEAAGVLQVYATDLSSQCYQTFIGYSGGMYYRSWKGSAWADWNKLAVVDASANSPELEATKEYSIVKSSDSRFYIYKRGSKGYIRYTYALHKSDTINLNVWRLYSIEVCANDKSVIKTISSSGADLDGVILVEGEADHIGGVHGDESFTALYIFIDGKQYTPETLVNCCADNVTVIVDSVVNLQDSTTQAFNKNKRTIFDREGVHIKSRWVALRGLQLDSVKGCMFSIQKDCFTHWYDSNVNLTPTAKRTETATSQAMSQDAKVVDVFYVGDVYAHHWAGLRSGDASAYGTLVNDYGERYKSYFNSYNDTSVSVGETLEAENHFYITY